MRTFSSALLLASGMMAGALMSSSNPALAVPSQLYGKSVVVSWAEEREQRVGAGGELRNVVRNGQFSIYVSSTGKAFSRMSYAFSARGGMKTGKKDAVSGESKRQVSFTGNSLMMTSGHGSGGARNIRITFDGGFQGCSAQVLSGKAAGVSAVRAKSMVTGEDIEIVSIKTGAASCSIRDGNIFGD